MTEPRRSPAGRAGCGLLVSLFILLAIEIVLRLAGFRYDPSASYMVFNFPNPNELYQLFEPDPVLLWRMRGGYDTGDGFVTVNAQGFRGPDFSALPKSGLRIACIGDSVTFGAPEADFPRLLERKLDESGTPAQVLNFGVAGYSSWQGRRLLPMVLDEYHPYLVVILFGWNDHWLARGFPDDEQVVSPPPALTAPLRRLRIYQLINRGRALVAGKNNPVPAAAGPARLRVAPNQYRENLLAMAEMVRQAGAVPLFATAPSAIDAGVVPGYLMGQGFIAEPSDLAPLHARYNELTRRAAAEAGAALCDIDAAFEKAGAPRFFRDPSQDLIHPSPRGYAYMAELLAGCVERVEGPKK